LENKELKKTIDRLELEKAELKENISKGGNIGKKLINEESEINELKEVSNF
jgi:hypothetical protein